MELITSKIKDIIYKVAPSGKLVAILVLQQKEELIDEEDTLKNAILLDNALLIHSNGYHAGSKLEINTEDLGNPIHKVLNISYSRPLPTKCPSCGETLSKHFKDKKVDYIECTNVFCTGQSQSHLFRLLAYMFVGTDLHILRKFLDEYVTVGSSTTDIRNITDFEKIYMTIKGRNTRTRLNQWIKAHGEYLGEKLFEIDIAIEKKLSEPELPKKLFWLVANLPIGSESSIIEKIHPKMFLAGRDEVFKTLKHKQQNYLMDNMDFILKLINIFQTYGNKEWN